MNEPTQHDNGMKQPEPGLLHHTYWMLSKLVPTRILNPHKGKREYSSFLGLRIQHYMTSLFFNEQI